MRTVEIIFEVMEAREGGYDAKALGHSIFTLGEDWDDLKAMVRDAVLCHFEEDDTPRVIRLRQRGSHHGMRLPRGLSGNEVAVPHWALGTQSISGTLHMAAQHAVDVGLIRTASASTSLEPRDDVRI